MERAADVKARSPRAFGEWQGCREMGGGGVVTGELRRAGWGQAVQGCVCSAQVCVLRPQGAVGAMAGW